MSDETKKTQETELSDEQLEKAAGGTDARPKTMKIER